MNGAEVTFTGNIVRFELRFSANGTPWGTGAIAVNEFRRDRDGNKNEEATFVNFKVFRDLAENMAESVDKGTRVTLTGRLKNETWTDREGNERRELTLNVDEAAVSLRWATAKVTRTNSGGNARGGAPTHDDAPVLVGGGEDDNPFM